MKIVFIGTTEFGIPSLERLKQEHEIALVVTQPDKPAGRKKIMTSPPVKLWADLHNLPVIQPAKIREILEDIKKISPDLIITASYGKIIPEDILNIPKHKSINIHPSLLPKFRGPSPIQSAILEDEKVTGITIMLMDKEMDHGPILAQENTKIDDADNFQTLHDKLAHQSAELLAKTITSLETIVPQEQNHDSATFTKFFAREDGKIDWTEPASKIVQQINALNPEPGTWTTLDNKSVKILSAEETSDNLVDLPGKIYSENKSCMVKAGDYSVMLLMVQPEGKKPMTGQDFINGIKNIETKILK